MREAGRKNRLRLMRRTVVRGSDMVKTKIAKVTNFAGGLFENYSGRVLLTYPQGGASGQRLEISGNAGVLGDVARSGFS